MTVESIKNVIFENIDTIEQVESGKTINKMIKEITSLKFNELKKDFKKDQLDDLRFKRIKKTLMVGSVVLAVAGVLAAVAGIIFSAGTVAAGSLTLAAVSGMVGITTSFNGLDATIGHYLDYIKEEKAEKNRINKTIKKIENVSTLIKARVDNLDKISEEKKKIRAKEILGEINTINAFIVKLKELLPTKVMQLKTFDLSLLSTSL